MEWLDIKFVQLLVYVDALETQIKNALVAYGAKDEAKLQDALINCERTMRPQQ